MSSRIDEVKAAMHSGVHNVASVKATLILVILLKLVIYVLDYGFKTEIKYFNNIYSSLMNTESNTRSVNTKLTSDSISISRYGIPINDDTGYRSTTFSEI